MHTYKKTHGRWAVGYLEQQSDSDNATYDVWRTVKEFQDVDEAAAYVNYLNGGRGLLQAAK